MTLNHFYTDTTVQFSKRLNADQITINRHPKNHNSRIVNFLNLIRRLAHRRDFARIKSVNHVPTAAGLASSASGLAALAAAASRAAGLKLSQRELSRLARRGSGSATRSIYGGWVEWQRGNRQTSYAKPLDAAANLKTVQIIAMILKRAPKKISSRHGMQHCVETSPYYPTWRKIVAKDLVTAKKALQTGNFRHLGQVAETNAFRMHALTLSANPGFTYFNAATLKAIHCIRQIRKDGIECYCTIDAGPNVKVICQAKDSLKIKRKLDRVFNPQNIIITGSGPGIQYLKD